MKPRTESWILVADSRRARLLCGSMTPMGRTHLEEKGCLEHKIVERQPPPTLGRMGGHSHAALDHEEEQELHRFAREVASWLEKEFEKPGFDRLEVFAPARFLGAFNKVIPARLKSRFTEHDVELMHMTAGDLARHPAVERCVAG